MRQLLLVPILLSFGCGTAPLQPDGETEYKTITIQAAPGRKEGYALDRFEEGERVDIKVTLESPLPSDRWTSSASVCVIGATPGDSKCIHYALNPQSGLLHVMYQPEGEPTSPLAADLTLRPFKIGDVIPLNLTLHSQSPQLNLPDGERLNFSPDFKVTGFSINCVGATCKFTLPFLKPNLSLKAPTHYGSPAWRRYAFVYHAPRRQAGPPPRSA